MSAFFCRDCGWHPCRCDWRAMECQRVAELEAQGVRVRRVAWVCEHSAKSEADRPYLRTSDASKSHEYTRAQVFTLFGRRRSA
jgi:hypothetical protein